MGKTRERQAHTHLDPPVLVQRNRVTLTPLKAADLKTRPYARPSASRAFYPALFTLLTICLAALTAGVAIPVRGFLTDRVQSGAINYEFANVQKAVDLMRVEYSLGSLPDPGPSTSKGLRKDPVDATRDMSVFPYMEHGDYALFGGSTGDYLTHNTEALYYVDVAGMVYQIIPEAR